MKLRNIIVCVAMVGYLNSLAWADCERRKDEVDKCQEQLSFLSTQLEDMETAKSAKPSFISDTSSDTANLADLEKEHAIKESECKELKVKLRHCDDPRKTKLGIVADMLR